MGMPRSRQTVLTSATFPESVQFLAQDFLKEYTFMAVGTVGAASSSIKQKILWVDDDDKDAYLYGVLLHQRSVGLTLIFVNQKTTATDMERFLGQLNIRNVSIHGDKTQQQREEALWQFKSGKIGVLIATDVAARGLDIPDVQLVVQYDIALSVDDMVHRIGRTGRIGKQGMAISFANNRIKGFAHEIILKLRQSGNEDAVPHWLIGMAIAAGTYQEVLDATSGKTNSSKYGGQDFRNQDKAGFKSREERDAAKKFTNFDNDAYGEGDAAKATQAAASRAGPGQMSFEQMANKGKSNKGGGKKGGGGGGKGGGKKY